MGGGFTGILVEPSPTSIIQATIFAVAGAALADKAFDEYQDATDDLEEINMRRLEMAEILQEHQLTVTHAYLKTAMDEALAYPVQSPNYSSMCSLTKNAMSNSLNKANLANSHYLKHFCIDRPSCNREFGFYAGIAAADAGFALARFQERREEREREVGVRVTQQAHAGTMRSPSGIFGLLDNAAQIYGYIQQQSFSNINGSLAMFGYGLQGIMGHFGRGGGT